MFTPYPFERLPKLTRAQVRAIADLHSLFSDTDLDVALRTAEVLIGATLSCSIGAPSACSGREIAARQAVWIELLLADRAGTEPSAWLELPFRFCELVIERMLGADGSLGIVPVGPKLEELRLGALAYWVARVCAASGPRFRLQMLHAGAAPPLSDAMLVRLAVRVAMADEAANLYFYAPQMLALDTRAIRSPLHALPALALTLWADAGFARLDLATLRSLHAGDVIVLEHTGLWREHADAEFQGSVDVRVLGSATALHCRLFEGRLEVETITCSAERSMTSGRRIPETSESELVTQTLERPAPESRARTRDLARDAPIEVALEISRFQLRLDELERVRPGDVLVTGRRIGERVILRLANQVFAEGELVDVEGELGVRITQMLTE